MPYLHWRESNGAILPAGSVRHGKDLLLTGEGYSQQPSTFTVYRRFGPMLRRFRERQGESSIAPVGNSVMAEPYGASNARAGPWRLPVPARRLGWRLFFVDDQLGQSGELNDTRLVTLSAAVAAPIEQFKISIGIKVTAAIDPGVQISLLTPWGDGGENFDQYVEELADDCEAAPDALREYLEPYLPFEPPEGWEFAVGQSEFTLDEGESVDAEILLSAPTSGATTFAIEASSVIDDEKVTVVSDPMVIEVPEDWRYASLLFGRDHDAGGGSALKPARRRKIVSAEEDSASAVLVADSVRAVEG